MKKSTLNRFVTSPVALLLFLMCAQARGQQAPPSKLEVGAEFSTLGLADRGFRQEVGVGGRVTLNLTERLALEAEGNFFPSTSTRGSLPGGNILQGQFGLKAGKRWQKFGIFAKARPGFISFDGNYAPRVGGTSTFNGIASPFYDFAHVIRQTHLSIDVGGVVEVYPSRRLIVRFDAGDTIIHYGDYDTIDFSGNAAFYRTPGQTTHNFQLTTGVSFRLMMPKDESAPADTSSSPAGKDSTPRYEAGAHYTTLTFDPPGSLPSLPLIFGDNRALTEMGFGGRFTVNLNDSVAIESVINYFPSNAAVELGATGRVLQGQFGVKAGKRFNRFGVFGKARPGFVSFDKSLKLVGMQSVFVSFLGRTVVVGTFEFGRRTFYANDFGGVLEFYPSRRLAVRFDAGDTIIRYTRRATPTILASVPLFIAPTENKHNFQFISGFSIRF